MDAAEVSEKLCKSGMAGNRYMEMTRYEDMKKMATHPLPFNGNSIDSILASHRMYEPGALGWLFPVLSHAPSRSSQTSFRHDRDLLADASLNYVAFRNCRTPSYDIVQAYWCQIGASRDVLPVLPQIQTHDFASSEAGSS